MKTIYSVPLLLIYVSLFGLAIYGCSVPTDPLSDHQSLNDNLSDFDISKVKANYEEEMSKISPLKTTGKNKNERILKRKLQWENTYGVTTPDGERLIVPFSLDDEIFLIDRHGSSVSYGASSFFIVSKKNNKNFNFEVATFISDDPENQNDLTENWTGKIVVEDEKGEFVRAFIVHNGKIVNESVNSEGGRITQQDCYEVDYSSCAYVPDIGYSAPCQYMYTQVICFPSVPPPTSTASNGFMGVVGGVISYGGATGGAGSIYGQVVDRVSKIKRFTNYTTGQLIRLNDVLEELVARCVGKTIYGNLVAANHRMDWYIDPNLASSGGYQPGSKKVIFQSMGEINYNTLTEELFHAYQNTYYPGGTTQYLDNGKSNIEFEAKMLQDMARIINGEGCCVTVPENYANAYYLWLVEITSNSTKYPTSV